MKAELWEPEPADALGIGSALGGTNFGRAGADGGGVPTSEEALDFFGAVAFFAFTVFGASDFVGFAALAGAFFAASFFATTFFVAFFTSVFVAAFFAGAFLTALLTNFFAAAFFTGFPAAFVATFLVTDFLVIFFAAMFGSFGKTGFGEC